MTAAEILGLGMGFGIIIALVAHAQIMLKATQRIITAIKEKPVSSSVHQDIAKNLHRLALATEKAANDRPAQIESKRVQDMNEVLVQGVIGVLDTTLTHNDGLKDDVILGRNQAAEELKTLLKDALDKALKQTHN